MKIKYTPIYTPKVLFLGLRIVVSIFGIFTLFKSLQVLLPTPYFQRQLIQN